MNDEASGSKQRPDGRAADELRTVTFKNNIAPHATGSTNPGEAQYMPLGHGVHPLPPLGAVRLCESP